MKKKTCCYLGAKTSNTKIEKETSTADLILDVRKKEIGLVLITLNNINKSNWIITFLRIFHSMQRPIQFDSISIECNAGTSWLTTQQSSWRSRAIRCLHLVIPSNYSICVSFVYFCLPQTLWFVWYLYILSIIKLTNNDHFQVAGLNVHPVDSISSCAHLLKVGIANRSLFYCSFVVCDHGLV